MAEIVDDLITFLSVDAGLSPLIGFGNSARIFEHVIRQKVSYPALVLDEGPGLASNRLGPSPVEVTNLAQTQILVMALGLTKPETRSVWRAALDAIRNYGPKWMGDTFVHSCVIDTGWRDADMWWDPSGGQRHIYTTSSTFDIWYDPYSVPA